MSFEILVESLRRVALFQGLRPLQISEIARRAERVMFRAGDVIIKEDRPGDAAYLIVSGEAVRTSSPVTTESAEAVAVGTVIGEMAMLVNTAYSSTVTCRTPVRALRITRDSLHDQMRTDRSLADHLVEKLASRLQMLIDDLKRIDQVLANNEQIVSHELRAVKPVEAHA